jgi:hypothetical protein
MKDKGKGSIRMPRRLGLVVLGVGGGHVTQACHAIRCLTSSGDYVVERLVIFPARNVEAHLAELQRVLPLDKYTKAIQVVDSPALEWITDRILQSPEGLEKDLAKAAMAVEAIGDVFGPLFLQKLSCQVDLWLHFMPFLIDTLSLQPIARSTPSVYVAHTFCDDFYPGYRLLSQCLRALVGNVHRIHMRPRIGERCIAPLMDTRYIERVQAPLHMPRTCPDPPEILVYATSYGEALQRLVFQHILPRYPHFSYTFVGPGWEALEARPGLRALGRLPRSDLLTLMSKSSVLLTTAGNEVLLEARLLGIPAAAMAACTHAVEQLDNLAYYERLGYCSRLDKALDLEAMARGLPRTPPDTELLGRIKRSGDDLIAILDRL